MKTKLTYFLVLIIAAFLAACSSQPLQMTSTSPSTQQEPSNASLSANKSAKLGTQWGEGLESKTTTVYLNRVSNMPDEQLQLSYSARPQGGDAIKELPLANGRIGFAVLDQAGQKMTLLRNPSGIHLQGSAGDRYQLVFTNMSRATYEIVSTVDGLDVINGKAGSLKHRGYIVYPGDTLTIAGFRKSNAEVAAFRFAAQNDAYAANSVHGDVRNVGVIGVAVFKTDAPEKPLPIRGDAPPRAFPGDKPAPQSPFAPAPVYR